MVAHDPSDDLIGTLWFNADLTLRAHLRAQLHVQQTQEMVNFSHRGNGRFSTTAAGALLDCHRRWDTKNSIDIGFACRLHNCAGVGVERFKITALTFVKQDIKGQR